MLQWFVQFDPTVQVALIGSFGAFATGVWALIRVWLQPKKEHDEKEFGPQPVNVVFSKADQSRIDRITFLLENLADALERLRVDLK